jgi:hypothetical protein
MFVISWEPNRLTAPQNKRFQRTRPERGLLLSCVGEPLKRDIRRSN